MITLLTTCFISIALINGECQVRINELNADTNMKNDKWEFLELRKVSCPLSEIMILDGYLILIIKEFENDFKKPSIVFTADLSTFSIPSNIEYFLIGSPHELYKPELPFSHNNVMYRNKRTRMRMQIDLNIEPTDKTFEIIDAIEDGNVYTMAVIILQLKSEFHINYKKQLLLQYRYHAKSYSYLTKAIPINNEIETVIADTIVDMFLFSRRSFYNNCGFFKRLASRFSNTKQFKISTEWDGASEDLSSNRCPSNTEELLEPLLFTTFKLGYPTPNKVNDCTGAQFSLQDNLDKILNYVDRPLLPKLQSKETPNACSSSTRITDYMTLTTKAVSKTRDCTLKRSKISPTSSNLCPCIQNAYTDSDDVLREVENTLHQPISLPTNNALASACKKTRFETVNNYLTYKKPWEDTTKFDENWITQIAQYQSRYVATTIFTTERKLWLQYIFNQNEPKMSTFKCRWCHEYFLHKNTAEHNTPKLAQAAGFYVPNYQRMFQQLTTHSQSGFHSQAVLHLKESYATTLKQCSLDIKRDRTQLLASNDQQATVRMIRTVYFEIKSNLPLDSHEDLIHLQKVNGIDLGTHHYGRTSATTIMENISEKMHHSLVNHLKTGNRPISIIVDTSTDSANRNFLLIYLRSMEGNTPQTYFYRALKMKSETSENMYQLLIDTFNEDKLLTTINQQLRAFSSDGAPAMQGLKGGLAQRINTSSIHDVYNIHCLAHKLQLAVGHAMDNVHGYKDVFEQFVKSIYSFYYNKSFKRKESLVETAESLGEVFHELSNINTIRWVASEKLALDKIYVNYRSLVNNMVLISESKQYFGDDNALKAESYSKTLLNVRFATTLVFTIDVLDILTDVSLQFQKGSSTLIGKEQVRSDLIKRLEDLKTSDGKYLQQFIKQSTCKNGIHWTECNVRNLDTCDVTWRVGNDQIILKQPPTNRLGQLHGYTALSTLRTNIINSVIAQLLSYFPEGNFKMFDVFNPSNLPMDLQKMEQFCLLVKPFAKRFGFDETLLSNQLCDFVKELIANHYELYCDLINKKDPIHFWSNLFQNEMLKWPEELKQLIEIAITIPIGSADVERGFSIFKNFYSKSRNRLTPKHVEDILRIRINGPPATYFDPDIYALHWLSSGHIKVDDPRKVKQKKSMDISYSRLF